MLLSIFKIVAICLYVAAAVVALGVLFGCFKLSVGGFPTGLLLYFCGREIVLVWKLERVE